MEESSEQEEKLDSFQEYLRILDEVDEQVIKEETKSVGFRKVQNEKQKQKSFVKKAFFKKQQKVEKKTEEQLAFPASFFIDKFAFKEPSLTQKYLENFVVQSLAKEDIPDFVACLVKQATQLSQQIPNIEFVFYKTFSSPQTSKLLNYEKHSQLIDTSQSDLLEGNIYQANIGLEGYKSILQSLLIKKKKKHLKKVLAHMERYDQLPDLDFIELFLKVCVKHGFPVLMGRAIKDWIGSKQLHIPLQYITQTILYLESCKGHEEDAKLFLFYLGGLPHYNLDWDTSAPLFRRFIKYRDLDSLIGFYEQFRKKIVINNPPVEDESHYRALKEEKFRELHFNLIKELVKQNRLKGAKIILNELLLTQKEGASLFRSKPELAIFIDFYAKAQDFKNFHKTVLELEEKFTIQKEDLEHFLEVMKNQFPIHEQVKQQYLGFYQHLIDILNNNQIRDLQGKMVLYLVKMFFNEGKLNLVQNLVYWVHSEMTYRDEENENRFGQEAQGNQKKETNEMPPKGLISFLKDMSLHSVSQEQRYKLRDLSQLLLHKQADLRQKYELRKSSSEPYSRL